MRCGFSGHCGQLLLHTMRSRLLCGTECGRARRAHRATSLQPGPNGALHGAFVRLAPERTTREPRRRTARASLAQAVQPSPAHPTAARALLCTRARPSSTRLVRPRGGTTVPVQIVLRGTLAMAVMWLARAVRAGSRQRVQVCARSAVQGTGQPRVAPLARHVRPAASPPLGPGRSKIASRGARAQQASVRRLLAVPRPTACAKHARRRVPAVTVHGRAPTAALHVHR